MNRYGQIARQRMERFQPAVLAGIEDPDSYFLSLGQELEREIEELAEAIAGPAREGETYAERLGRLREARISAESDLMAQVGAPLEEPAPVWPREPEWTPIGAPVRLSPEDLQIEQEREADRRRQLR